MSFEDPFTARASDAPHFAPGTTDAIAAFVSALRYDGLDPDVRHFARQYVLDTVGLMIAGATSDVVVRTEETLSSVRPAGPIPVVGRARRADLLDATLLGGMSAHDVTPDNAGSDGTHAVNVIVPATFAMSFKMRASGKAIIEAIVGGYVTATAVGRASRRDGPACAIGAIGAAMAGGKLQGLSARRLTHATSIAAATMTSPSSASCGRDIDRLRTGHAARNGLEAALLAARGVEGPTAAVIGYDSYLAASAFAQPMAAVVLPSSSASGSRHRPHSDDELDRQFFDRAAPTFGATGARTLIGQLRAIDTLDDITPLLEALAAPWD